MTGTDDSKRGVRALTLCACLLAGTAVAAPDDDAPEVSVGSKTFTESVILGEIAAGLARDAGAQVQHRRQLGGTRILWRALLEGQIDAYPEYTGTLARELLQMPDADAAALRAALAERGLAMTASLGFDNSYALGMRSERARALGIDSIGDLRARKPACG